MTETVVKTQVSSALLLGLVGSSAVFAFSFFWTSLFNFNREAKIQPPATVTASPSPESLTTAVLTQLAAYQQNHAADRLTQLTSAAEKRRQKLEALMTTDPAKALRVATLSSQHDTLPPAVQPLVETTTSLHGTVTVRHGDNIDGTEFVRHLLKTGDRTYTLHFETTPALITGQSVTIASAIVLDNEALVPAETTSGTTLQSNVSTTGTTTAIAGAHKVAIILFNFQDDVRSPMTTDQVRQTVFTNTNSIAAYYREASFNQTDLIGKLRADGDVFGWYTIPSNQPQTSADCNGVDTWASQADTLAAKDGFTASGYDHYVYVMPWLSTQFSVCPWAGLSDVGGNHVWINGAPNYVNLRILGHEIGHNYGLDHANAYRCTDGSGQTVAFSTNCTLKSYADLFDVMGNYPFPNRQFSTFRKGSLNWYASGDTVDVTGDGTFTLTPIEQSAGGTKAIRIARPGATGNTQYFYLEFRQPSGTFDNFSPTDPEVNGVTINLGPAYGSSVRTTELLDTTPATTDTSSTDNSGFADAALAAGQTFTDANTGISITTSSVTTAGATVSIHFGAPTCQHVMPITQQSPAMSGSAGTPSAQYYFNVASNENSTCPSETYTVTPNLPAGWTQTVTPTSLTLAPQQFSTFNVSLLPRAGTPPGVYTFGETFTNAAAPAFSPSVTSSYTIVVSENTPPVVTISSPANGSTLPSRGKVNIAASATDDSGVGQIQIAIDGAVVKTCTASSCGYSWSMSRTVITGNHTITVTAQDNSPAHNTGTASITVKK